jgi:uncharacterized membrane protein (DUF106 family)
MMESSQEAVELLRRIERNQQEQLARQQRALEVQEQQFEMVRRQFERAEKLQDRAEKMQDTGAAMMHTARKALAVVLPIVIVLIIYLSWLIFR